MRFIAVSKTFKYNIDRAIQQAFKKNEKIRSISGRFSNSQTIDGQTTFYSPIDFDVPIPPREFSTLVVKICCLLVCSFSLPSKAVTKVTILPFFSQDCRYF